MVNTGGLGLSRVSKRFAVAISDSSPNTSHPKLLAGSSSQDCTSARICDELHVYTPTAPTDWLALTVAEKSPPSVVQKIVSKKRCRQVASLGVAGAPSPSSPGATDVPSPQSASSLCSSTVRAVPVGVLDIFKLNVTPRIVEPAGTFPAMSKASTPRRSSPVPVSPAKKCWPSALLTSPSTASNSYSVLSLMGLILASCAIVELGQKPTSMAPIASGSRILRKVGGWVLILIFKTFG
jgi:hypothetical protein